MVGMKIRMMKLLSLSKVKQGGKVKGKDMSNNGDEGPFDLSQEKRELEDFIVHHGKGEEISLNMLKTCSTVEDIKEFLTVFTALPH
jgi:hypothetical protein